MEVQELKQIYASPKEIGKAYSLGHTHVYSLLHTMRESKRYKEGFPCWKIS